VQSAACRTDINEDEKPRVTPRLHPLVRDCLDQKDFLFDLVDRFGSPLNIVFPQVLDGNVAGFQDIYKKYRLRGRIYYVTKPCKSLALMAQAKNHEIGIDVSSPASLRQALGQGWNAGRIIANGPKNADYIQTAMQNGVLLAVDNFDELQKIVSLHKTLSLPSRTQISIRLCGFESARVSFTPHDNSFGIHLKHLGPILDYLLEHKSILDFQGFSFHIAGQNDEQRLVAIENTLMATFESVKRGLSPKGINIGGGFPIMYADSCAQWHAYVEILKQSVLNKTASQTWNNTGLGYRLQNGVLAGGAMFTDHAPVRAKGEALEYLLTATLPAFKATFAEVLRDSLLELSIEPGKAMLDQCGITLGRVNFTKESSWGETLVGLDMNRSNIQSMDQKMLTDPIVLYRDPSKNRPHRDGVYYMGNLCLAYDMIQYNKTYPPLLPREGDVVAFANSAAYLMDFVESESLMQPLARKVAVVRNDGLWNAIPDAEYTRKDLS